MNTCELALESHNHGNWYGLTNCMHSLKYTKVRIHKCTVLLMVWFNVNGKQLLDNITLVALYNDSDYLPLYLPFQHITFEMGKAHSHHENDPEESSGILYKIKVLTAFF